ncbi:25417_t:CDS:1, partial [Racocetra persica]
AKRICVRGFPLTVSVNMHLYTFLPVRDAFAPAYDFILTHET